MDEEALRVRTWDLIVRLETFMQQRGIAYATPIVLESDSLIDLRSALKMLAIALYSAPV